MARVGETTENWTRVNTGEVRAPKAGTEYQDARMYTTGPGNEMVSEWDAESAISKGYYSNIFVWACVHALAEDVAALMFRAGADPKKPEQFDENSPLAHLLGSPPYGPNIHTTGKQLLSWSIAQLLVTGRFSWELAYDKGRGASKAPTSLWPLVANKFAPVASAEAGEYFSHYMFDAGTRRRIKLMPHQVLYYWRPSQHDWRQPESALQAARLDVSVAVMQDRYDYAFLRNDARPAQVVVHEKFTERGAKDAFRGQFLDRHAGPDNAGRTAFVEASEDGAKPSESLFIQQIGLSQRDAQFIERYDRKIRAIIVAFGVPISRLGDSSEKTFANASVEYEVYLRDRVEPLAKELQDAINLQLAPRVGKELGWFDLSPIKDAVRDSKLQTGGITDLVKTRIIKINEGRQALGLAPVDDGDRFLSDVELGFFQQGAATLIIPETSSSAAPYERGQEETEPAPPPAAPEVAAKAPTPAKPDAEPPATKQAKPVKDERAANRSPRETARIKAYMARDERVKPIEEKFEVAFQKLLDAQLKHIVSRIGGKRGRQMLRVGAEGRQDALNPAAVFDISKWKETTAVETEELYKAIAADALLHASSMLAIDFELVSEWADDFIQARANQLAFNVTDTTYADIQSALIEGVQDGESIPNLIKRIEGLFQQTYKNRARAVARTEVISAFNGATALLAANSPVEITTMEWIATPGPRTRASHAAADGQKVSIGAKFTVGNTELEYPGDPSGPAKEVINCRCALAMLTAEDLLAEDMVDLPRWEPKNDTA